jgi:hypothetical protein
MTPERRAARQGESRGDYDILLDDIVAEIRRARAAVLRTSNAVVIELYWRIGRLVLNRQEAGEGHGTRVIGRNGRRSLGAVPRQRGFSRRNLRYMRAFAAAMAAAEIVQNVLQHLPWGHVPLLWTASTIGTPATGTSAGPSRSAGRAPFFATASPPSSIGGRSGAVRLPPSSR